MRKPFYIMPIVRQGKNRLLNQDITYRNIRFFTDAEKPIHKVLKDKNGKRVEWFLKPIDSHQKQMTKDADSVLSIIIRDYELQRDKGELTWEMLKQNKEVESKEKIVNTSWGKFIKEHCQFVSGQLSNYTSFIERNLSSLLSASVTEVCKKSNITTVKDCIEDGIKGRNGVVSFIDGKKYSPITLKHYWDFHIDSMQRALDLDVIKELPSNAVKAIPKLKIAINKTLEEKKGQYFEDELKLIKDYLNELRSLNPNTNKKTYPERQEALKAFLFSVAYTGLRETDLVDLKWGHIEDDDKNNYKLTKVMNKVSSKVIIFFSKKAEEYIGKPKGKNDFVFNLKKDKATSLWKSIKKEIGLKNKGRKRLSFGMSRHTHAYKLINALQKDKATEGRFDLVQTRLGHTNIKTTLKHYTEIPDAYYKKTAKVLQNVEEFEVI